jgi:hypothetical protein
LRNQRRSVRLWLGTGWWRFRAYPRACAFPQFSVKVVRHRGWNYFCGRLWKSDGGRLVHSRICRPRISTQTFLPMQSWYPPLQRTQGWGTLTRNGAGENVTRRVGHPPIGGSSWRGSERPLFSQCRTRWSLCSDLSAAEAGSRFWPMAARLKSCPSLLCLRGFPHDCKLSAPDGAQCSCCCTEREGTGHPLCWWCTRRSRPGHPSPSLVLSPWVECGDRNVGQECGDRRDVHLFLAKRNWGQSRLSPV